ncbi:MAG: hypothetical protein GWO23_18200 [Gammaproteobacteria bacterium]|nr:hypothetical protein [Gammaproteobacteria bacterium]
MNRWKIKIVGVARQQLHFLCGDKENEAKESSFLAGVNVCRFLIYLEAFLVNKMLKATDFKPVAFMNVVFEKRR